jgi:hypothetical protein
VQREIDAAFPTLRGGVKQSASITQQVIFDSRLPASKDVRDGLIRVCHVLLSAHPTGLGPFTTHTVNINDAPKGAADKSDMPGGLVRFTRFQVGKQSESVLIEGLGRPRPAPTPGRQNVGTKALFETQVEKS